LRIDWHARVVGGQRRSARSAAVYGQIFSREIATQFGGIGHEGVVAR